MKRSAFASVIGWGASLGLALMSTPAQAALVAADPTPSPSPSSDVSKTSISPAKQAAARSYWTADRLRNAKPGDSLVRGKSLADATGKVAVGKPSTKSGTSGKSTLGLPNLAAFGGGYYTGGGNVIKTTGKVFFTLGGSNYVCSGSSVVSGNKSVVQTAGHCVNEGPGAFATNFVFIPQYDDGAAPYGQFAARQLVTTSQWSGSGDLNYDAAFAVVSPVGGVSLTDKVGGQGVAFNQARLQNMYSFGYPAAAPYDGTDIAWCHGNVVADSQGSSDQGMVCNMTGGSSGGPWFLNYNEGAGIGTLNSLNSFKYTSPLLSDKMYGPYFGSVIQAAYNSAQGL